MATADLRLEATTRDQQGRHVRHMRREGQVPAVLYGHRVQPVPLAIDERSLQRVWHRAGRSHLVDLALDGGRARKVLIRELQIDPRSTRPLHVDFFAVNLREKIGVDLPVVPTGESPAINDLKIGVLQQLLNTVRVECLPGDIPPQLTVDISELTEVDAGIHLRDLPLPDGVTLAAGVDPDELVVKIAALRVATEAEEEAAEAPAAESAADADQGAATEQ